MPRNKSNVIDLKKDKTFGQQSKSYYQNKFKQNSNQSLYKDQKSIYNMNPTYIQQQQQQKKNTKDSVDNSFVPIIASPKMIKNDQYNNNNLVTKMNQQVTKNTPKKM